jgi:hypothetical protein
MGKTSQNFGSISASITSYDHKRNVYDPYDVTSFEEKTPSMKKNTLPKAPLKIKLAEGSFIKKVNIKLLGTDEKSISSSSKIGPIKAGKLILKKSAVKLSETPTTDKF